MDIDKLFSLPFGLFCAIFFIVITLVGLLFGSIATFLGVAPGLVMAAAMFIFSITRIIWYLVFKK